MSSLIVAVADAESGGDGAPLIHGDCRVPGPKTQVEARFTRHTVKVFMVEYSGSGKQKISSETYSVTGVLHPVPAQISEQKHVSSGTSEMTRSPQSSSPAKRAGQTLLEAGDDLYDRGQYMGSFAKYLDADVQGDATVKGRAEYRIGMLYLDGEGVTYSPLAAAKWLNLAADHGNKDAQLQLSRSAATKPATGSNPAEPLPEAPLSLFVAVKKTD